jgi:hypothetical protein
VIEARRRGLKIEKDDREGFDLGADPWSARRQGPVWKARTEAEGQLEKVEEGQE